MTTNLAEIRAREAAAIKGPWRFDINLKSRHVSLVALISGYEFVMGTRRWGMGGATFEFQKHSQCLMYKAEEFAVPIVGREHHADWCQTLDHPDANFIAHSREDIPYLLAEVDRLRKALDEIVVTAHDRDGWTGDANKLGGLVDELGRVARRAL